MNDMLKTITLPQALVFFACLAAMFAAYKFLGQGEASQIIMLASLIINFMLGRAGASQTKSEDK